MKFIKLESRGGNYLVVAENVAWLRTAENGQTSVGIVGGQPLLVVGSIEEVAEKILAASAHDEEVAPAPAPAAEPVATSVPEPAPAPEEAADPWPVSEPERAPAQVDQPQSVEPEPPREPEPIKPPAVEPARKAVQPVRPMKKGTTLAERVAAAAAASR